MLLEECSYKQYTAVEQLECDVQLHETHNIEEER